MKYSLKWLFFPFKLAFFLLLVSVSFFVKLVKFY